MCKGRRTHGQANHFKTREQFPLELTLVTFLGISNERFVQFTNPRNFSGNVNFQNFFVKKQAGPRWQKQ